jgi:membrane peptidoglycan carboxypeptidase
MQLVKNVFLSRSKTIARKLEEMLIVWLIENQQLATKDRMFEVYLNIIEWGPMVYGANEASRFYFSKDVSRLTYSESIFLASIIPKPKWFRYSFDSAGHLRPELTDYYRLVSTKMVAKGWVSQHDMDALVPDVELKSPARDLLRKRDSISE